MLRLSTFSLILVLLTSTSANAQRSWTLQECIDYAVENNAQMEVQRAHNRINDLSLRDAQLNLLPSVGGYSSATYIFGRSPDPSTNTYANTQYFGNGYSVDASMPLFAGFANINNVRLEKFRQLRGQKEAQKKADDIALEILMLYYEALYRNGLVQLAQEQVGVSAKEVERMQVQARLGLKAKADIAEAEAKHAADEYMLINSQNIYEDALLSLKRRMSYPIDRPLWIGAAPEELREIVGMGVNADSLFAVALDHLPQNEASEFGVRQARAALAMQKGLMLPRLSLGGGYSTRYYNSFKDETGSVVSFRNQFTNNATQNFGVSLSIPIFSGLNRWSNKERARQNLRIAQVSHDDLLQEVYKEVQKAVQDLNASVKAYNQALKQERARELAHQMNQRKYEEGLISILDLYTSANMLLAAKVETMGNKFRMNA
ncbi:MAG: TolC family protein, partial [Bacteroidales bacterium]|nr:TolC family protein [Bacteroidales bacterium]